MEKIPKDIQESILRYQQLEHQSITLAAQKQSIEIRIKEINRGLEALESYEKGNIYKSIGSVLIQMDKELLIKELKDEQETLDLRMRTIEKQLSHMKSKLGLIQSEISERMSEGEKSEIE